MTWWLIAIDSSFDIVYIMISPCFLWTVKQPEKEICTTICSNRILSTVDTIWFENIVVSRTVFINLVGCYYTFKIQTTKPWALNHWFYIPGKPFTSNFLRVPFLTTLQETHWHPGANPDQDYKKSYLFKEICCDMIWFYGYESKNIFKKNREPEMLVYFWIFLVLTS